MKLAYNSPVILTFTIISAIVLMISEWIFPGFRSLFTVYEFSWGNPVNYFQLVSHIAGHGNWPHLLGNFSFILLLGPIMEDKYGSKTLLLMILITGFITGVLNVIIYDSGLLGASGIVFMLIILSGFSSFRSGKIPITLVLVVLLYIGKELVQIFQEDQVSQFAHILGGICGGVFGYLLKPGAKGSGNGDNAHPITNIE